MADATLSDIVEDVSSEDGVRKVKVEITHKHEERSSGTTWAIAIGMALLLGLGFFFISEKTGDLIPGSEDEFGCDNDIDDDGGGSTDYDDPDCWTLGEYDESNSETDPDNDPDPSPNP